MSYNENKGQNIVSASKKNPKKIKVYKQNKEDSYCMIDILRPPAGHNITQLLVKI